MPSTRDLHPPIIQSRSREPCRSASPWNIRVCESVGAWHEPSGARKGEEALTEGREGRWWFASDLVGCRESPRSEACESGRRTRNTSLPSMAIAIFLRPIFSIHSCTLVRRALLPPPPRINESLMARFKIQSIRAPRNCSAGILQRLAEIITRRRGVARGIASGGRGTSTLHGDA